MLRIISLAPLLLSFMWVQAQPTRPDAVPGTSYHELHGRLDAYYADGHRQRGGGWKHFKRWEWFAGQRTGESGMMPNGEFLLREIDRVKMQRSYRSGGDWQIIGPQRGPYAVIGYPADGIGRITALAFHPLDTNIIWAGAPSGGLWRTTNSGANWENMTPDMPNLGVGDLVIHPHHPDTMYLASGDGSVSDTYSYGLLRSADGGVSWEATGLTFNIPDGINFRRVVLDPLRPHILLAATNDGLKRSVDAGETFVTVTLGHFTDIQWQHGQSDTVVASTFSWTGGARVMHSTDGGITWQMSQGLPPTNVERIKVRSSLAAPRRVYALCSNTQSGFRGLWRSEDGGMNFEPMASTPNIFDWSLSGDENDGASWYAMDIAVSNTDPDHIVAGSVSLWHSTNGGESFVPFSHWHGASAPYSHADHHRLAFHPVTNRFFTANDGGVFRKAWNFNGFNLLSEGMSITQFYKMAHGTQDANLLLAGAQDNGTMRLRNGLWTIVFGGDGMQTLIHPEDGNIMFCTTQNGSLYRSNDAGFNFTSNLSPDGMEGQWVVPFVIEPQGGTVMYGGWNNKVYRSDDLGNGWYEFSPDMVGGSVTAMAISPQDNERMYVTTGSRVYRTTDLGSAWDMVSSGLPGGITLTGVAVHPYNKEEVWITISGYTDGRKVFRSRDSGNTWQNMSTGLPNLPANCIAIEKSSVNGVYVGTDAGVYYWEEGMDAWEPFMSGLPNVIVTDIHIHEGEELLRIATYGRGLWESPLMNGLNIGIREEAAREAARIFPVPATDAITIVSDRLTAGEKVQVLDAFGRQVNAFIVSGQQHTFKVASMPSGIYYLRSLADGRVFGRFIVQ